MPKRSSTSAYIRPINLGFVPLCDSAPAIIAKEKGIFDSYDLKVKLSREPGWATVRDKLAYGELDAAEAVVGLVFALQLGLGCLASKVTTPLILSANGNAITLGKHIPKDILTKDNGLKNYLKKDFKNDRPFTMAAVHPFSCHNFLLHTWLRRQGVIPGEQVDIVFLPPSVLSRNLEAGIIDGFCVGEPWNSMSIMKDGSWCAETSRDIDHNHPEKALICSEEFSTNKSDEMLRLTAAMIEACMYCANPDNKEEIITILAQQKYLDTNREYIANVFNPEFHTGNGDISGEDLLLFHGDEINRPNSNKANWILSNMRQTHLIPNSMSVRDLASIFRQDIYDQALEITKLSAR